MMQPPTAAARPLLRTSARLQPATSYPLTSTSLSPARRLRPATVPCFTLKTYTPVKSPGEEEEEEACMGSSKGGSSSSLSQCTRDAPVTGSRSRSMKRME